MEKKYYTARKVKPAGREGWIIEFRHPLIKEEKTGRPGKKVRRGLGTNNEVTAESFVEEMNQILSDESFWSPSSRLLAESKFNSGIVSAFYDEIEYLIKDYEKIRNDKIPMKNKENGYSRILLLGATGAGKTTLLRQIMGTDPNKERFPATSTAKTTVFDSEIILSEGNFKGMVTFYSESETRELIKDSVRNAIKKLYTTNNEKDALRIFLEDEEMRFRLSYILGKVKEKKRFLKYETTRTDDYAQHFDFYVTEEEQIIYEKKIQEYMDEIKSITDKIIRKAKEEYTPNGDLPEEDQLLLEELVVTDIMDYDEEDLANLTDNIIDEIKERFKSLDSANLVTEKFGWPIYFYKETDDRNDFIKSLRFFSSNSSYTFGKLLTPMVSGMRIQGPFKPDFLPNIPQIVILDGEGLGHIPDTTSNLPSKTISKFDISDAIILVDDSQSPMLAPPYAVIKSAAISGHYPKLFICFTHFDLVKGDNLPSISDKIDHVYGAVDNLLGKLENELGYEVKKYLTTHLFDKSYYLGNLDELFTSEDKFKFSADQFSEMINKLEKMKLPVELSDIKPTFEISTILFKIQNAAKRFHNIWEAHLFGTGSIPGIKKAHFTQIKALTRRLGYGWENEYSFLRPISDFWATFNEQISNFLSSPTSWVPSNPNEEEKLRKIDEIKQKVSTKIQKYAIDNLKSHILQEWQKAYDFSGKGSAQQRADKIDSIYFNAVPIPSEDMDTIKKKFVVDIVKIITETISECGGEIKSIFNHN